MNVKKIKKAAVAVLLAAVWAAAAWQTFIIIGVLSMTRMPKGFFRAAGSRIVNDFGPKWTTRYAINATAKCERGFGALETVEKQSKEQSRGGSIVSYRKRNSMPEEETYGLSDDTYTFITADGSFDALWSLSKRYSLDNGPYVSMIVDAVLDEKTEPFCANALMLVLENIRHEPLSYRFCEWYVIQYVDGRKMEKCLSFHEKDLKKVRSGIREWRESMTAQTKTQR
jgi:hypothetical protein